MEALHPFVNSSNAVVSYEGRTVYSDSVRNISSKDTHKVLASDSSHYHILSHPDMPTEFNKY